ncbi:uncharacterized protein [Solanum lycopersicum]|uniref:uncharacterized protein n=1 Tax=Solanum lycopersicum TaxID=4081 RepID=UPI003747F76A
MSVHYHIGKANVVADSLSRLSMGSVAHVEEERKELVKDVHKLDRLAFRLMSISYSGLTVQNGAESSLVVEGRLCVPDVGKLRQYILAEAHNSRYYFHQGDTKMYQDLREVYWWNIMERDIENFVTKCPNCQQVNVEYKKPGGIEIDIPTRKWEVINMDSSQGYRVSQTS